MHVPVLVGMDIKGDNVCPYDKIISELIQQVFGVKLIAVFLGLYQVKRLIADIREHLVYALYDGVAAQHRGGIIGSNEKDLGFGAGLTYKRYHFLHVCLIQQDGIAETVLYGDVGAFFYHAVNGALGLGV